MQHSGKIAARRGLVDLVHALDQHWRNGGKLWKKRQRNLGFKPIAKPIQTANCRSSCARDGHKADAKIHGFRFWIWARESTSLFIDGAEVGCDLQRFGPRTAGEHAGANSLR